MFKIAKQKYTILKIEIAINDQTILKITYFFPALIPYNCYLDKKR